MFQSTAAKTYRFSFWKYIALTWAMTKMSIQSAMEFRLSFLLQVFGMIVNDAFLVLIWIIFFKQFPEIRGWKFEDMALLYAVTMMNFSVVMIFARGAYELSRTIVRGELDYYLSFPVNVLWHVSVSKTEISAIGDLLFGAIMFFYAGNLSLERVGLFLLMVIVTSIIFFNFIIITQSISFYVSNFEDAAEEIFHALLGFTLYPQSVFYGALKLIMLTIIPAFFIAALPVSLIKNFDLQFFLYLILFAVITFIIAVFVFKRGLRKYESGNLINVKM